MSIILQGHKELQKELKALKKSVKKASTRALNKTAAKVKTQAAKKIGQEVALKAGYIKSKLKITRAKANQEYAIVFATRRGVLLSRYSNRQLTKKAKNGRRKKAGISVKVKRSGPRRKMKKAFYIRLKGSDVMGIAVRKRGMKGRGPDNYEVKHGPSVSQVWTNVRLGIKQDAQTWFYDIASRELNYELQKSGFK